MNDLFYLILIVLLAVIPQTMIQKQYNKYSKVAGIKGLTARQAAEKILRGQGIYDVNISVTSGSLTDNYNPTDKTLYLSETTVNSTSIAAVSVAAHECGHAIQHATGYGMLKFRTAFFPIASIGSKLYFPAILLGLILGFMKLVDIGIILFCAILLFQIITLPVEFNASKRAITILGEEGMLANDELPGAKHVLRAAAFTYVAAVLASALNLLRFVGMRRSRD